MGLISDLADKASKTLSKGVKNIKETAKKVSKVVSSVKETISDKTSNTLSNAYKNTKSSIKEIKDSSDSINIFTNIQSWMKNLEESTQNVDGKTKKLYAKLEKKASDAINEMMSLDNLMEKMSIGEWKLNFDNIENVQIGVDKIEEKIQDTFTGLKENTTTKLGKIGSYLTGIKKYAVEKKFTGKNQIKNINLNKGSILSGLEMGSIDDIDMENSSQYTPDIIPEVDRKIVRNNIISRASQLIDKLEYKYGRKRS